MRILINAFSTLGQRTGIGHYTAELVRCLQAQTAPGDIAVFPQGWAECLSRAWSAARPLWSRAERRGESARLETAAAKVSPLPWLRNQALAQLRRLGQAYLTRHLHRLMARPGYDLYHEPNVIPLPCLRPTVTTLHDLSPLLHPHWHPPSRVAFFEKNFFTSLGRAQHFLTGSEFTRQEVIRHLGLAPQRVTRVYHGIRPNLAPLSPAVTAATLRRLGLPAQYLLHVGTIEPRKNLLLLLRAYCSLPESLRQRWPLLLIGGWGWGCADVAQYLHAEARHRGVLHVGYLPDEHLAAVYNGARALVYPTWYEGFGLPAMEMLACGGAVLASTAGALAETVGGQAHLLDPADQDAWRNALARVVQDQDWWQELRRGAIETARPYTWDRCAAETLQVYRAVCAQDAATRAGRQKAA